MYIASLKITLKCLNFLLIQNSGTTSILQSCILQKMNMSKCIQLIKYNLNIFSESKCATNLNQDCTIFYSYKID